jgi:hypothetical protein
MNTPLDKFFEWIHATFWRAPLAARVALWMLGAWIVAWFPAYLSAGRENTVWLQMLPLYGICGVFFYALRLLMKRQSKRLRQLFASPQADDKYRHWDQISQEWIGIKLF